MKKYLIIIMLLLAAGSVNAGEFYVGHTIHGASLDPGQPVNGILLGDSFKLGVEIIGHTGIVHGIYETTNTFFVGLGGGYATNHKQLDGHLQFTVTAGIHLKDLTLRWIHHSNGADFLRSGNKDARNRNMGIDLLALSIHF